ncbi:MAG: rhamnulokinase family protein [Candidatus Ornithospirochaeta sp.]
MEERRLHLAVDIGASSGRVILGWNDGGKIETKETMRFSGVLVEKGGRYTWDVERLFSHVKEGIDGAIEEYPIASVAIDTWGVDYVLMNGDHEIWPCRSYRDDSTRKSVEAVHSIIPFSSLYSETGIQFQSFNTIYQLYLDKMEGRLDGATSFLMIPEYLTYRLTGKIAKEYTNATTTGLVDKSSGEFSSSIIDTLGLPSALFPSLRKSGEKVGEYRGVPVLLAPSHDTASAVEGMDTDEETAYISSGTWSLLGLKVPSVISDKKSMEGNWSNEGGVGYIRYQKNIMGMWLINSLRSELCPTLSFPEIVEEAEKSTFDGFVDASSPLFLSPKTMKGAFDSVLGEKGLGRGDYFRSAMLSLAKCYKKSILEAEDNTGIEIKKILITGGGAKNKLLNKLTAIETGKEVVAQEIEATAIGNLKSQMEAFDELH